MKLGLGCVFMSNVYGTVQRSEIKHMIHACMENDICHFDISQYYGVQYAQLCLEKYLVKRYPRDSFTISTAVSATLGNVEEQVYNSLSGLGLGKFGYIDIVYCNDVDNYEKDWKAYHSCLDVLAKLRSQGKIRQIGIVGSSLSDLDQLLTSSENSINIIQTYGCYTLANTTLLYYIGKWTTGDKRKVQVIQGGVSAMGLLSPHGAPHWHPAPPVYRFRCKSLINGLVLRNVSVMRQAFNHIRSLNPQLLSELYIGPADLHELWDYIVWNDTPVPTRPLSRKSLRYFEEVRDEWP